MDATAMFDLIKSELKGLQGVYLLKTLEKQANVIVANSTDFAAARLLLGESEEAKKNLMLAVTEANFKGIEEYSEKFYAVYEAASQRQQLIREWIKILMQTEDCAFEEFDRLLLTHTADIATSYDNFYLAWSKAVRISPAARKIQQMLEEQSDELHAIVAEKKLANNYTIITLNPKEEFEDVPYAVYFAEELVPIIEGFEKLIDALSKVENLTVPQQRMIEYLQKYKECLAITDKGKLEIEWAELDRVWMDVKYHIQIVHDIEYGYGDPLRTKVIPDFSVRILDPEFTEANKRIEAIQTVMEKYFASRKSKLAHEGLTALSNSMAGIYFLPFQSGLSLHFRFSGQSIPNRPEIKVEKGVKIYFDPVSTELRSKSVREMVGDLFVDPALINKINALDTIVNHIAGHEFGHAIYNLKSLGGSINIATESLLEEPRAELVAVKTMKLMFEAGMLTKEELIDSLFRFAASDLRRFAMYDSATTRPYTISAINTYKTYEALGYIKIIEDKLLVDLDKSEEVINTLIKNLEEILDAEDESNGAELENILEGMQKESGLVVWLVNKLQQKV